MKRLLLTALILTLSLGSVHAQDKAAKKPTKKAAPLAKAPVQLANGVVFLAEARPVFLRIVTNVDGKPLGQVWNEFIDELFAYLDVNKDGSLDEREVKGIPAPSQLFGGAIGVLQGRNSDDNNKSFKSIDLNKDKKVDVKEFASHYRKMGMTPFQFRVSAGASPGAMMAMAYGGGKPEPPVDAVSKESFRLLDVNRDGKLSLAELSKAPARAVALDENEDEMIIPQEIAPQEIPKFNPFARFNPLAGGSGKPGDEVLIPVFRIRNNPQKFLAMLVRRYGTPEDIKKLEESQPRPKPKVEVPMATEERPIQKKDAQKKSEPSPDKGKGRSTTPPKAETGAEATSTDKPEVKSTTGEDKPAIKEKPEDADKPAEKKEPKPKPKPIKVKFTQKQLGLDNRIFNRLDTNKDRVLDEKEVLLFAEKRQPDLAVVLHLGKDIEPGAAIRNPKKRPKVGRARNDKGKVLLDLTTSRVEILGGGDPTPPNPFEYVIKQQVTTQLKRADKNKDDVIDEKEAKESIFLNNGLFAQIDRDGDKKVTLDEMNQYLDDVEKLGAKARQSCVTLEVSNESRGLFTLFDSNSDRRLSVRELRQGPKLLKEFDREGKSHLKQKDIPQMHQLRVRQGNKDAGLNERNAFLALYSRQESKSYEGYTSGPKWFRKMDRNYDGDVSPKEFLFSKAEFAKVDTDGDGLISVDEANNASGK